MFRSRISRSTNRQASRGLLPHRRKADAFAQLPAAASFSLFKRASSSSAPETLCNSSSISPFLASAAFRRAAMLAEPAQRVLAFINRRQSAQDQIPVFGSRAAQAPASCKMT